MAPPADRVDVLAHRVRWLDRYRRPLALVISVVVFGLLAHQLRVLLDTWWPAVGVTISVLLAVGAWWLVEVGFAWLAALWETEYDRLVRERGLPRAEVVTRRK